ncbi:MAG: site-specific integrase [Henriciella sp.]
MSEFKLTKRRVDGCGITGKDYKVFDSEIPGFHLRVKPSGVKSYALKYRADGRQRNFTIGRHGVITAEEARVQARSLLASVAAGSDPSAAKKNKLSAPTLTELWRQYLEQHAIPHKAERSVSEDKGLWRLHIEPALAQYKVTAIGALDISKLHASLKAKPHTANRVYCLLSKMFNLSIEWGLRPDNPCRGVKKFREPPRHRYLSAGERKRLAHALSLELDVAGAMAIWLCMLTGARKGEVLQAKWEQFHLGGVLPVWTIPAIYTKQNRVNRKPLSAKVVLMLSDWKLHCAPSTSGWVIPGRDPERQRYDLKGPWNRVRKRAGLEDVRLHDLRHDFASMAVADGFSLEFIGRYLGHSSIQTTQRYAHLKDDPLQEMADRIGHAYDTNTQ